MGFKDILLIIINFAGALAVFLFAMKMMSEGLQKVAGSKMRAVLGKITGNPLSGILTGAAVTYKSQNEMYKKSRQFVRGRKRNVHFLSHTQTHKRRCKMVATPFLLPFECCLSGLHEHHIVVI